MVPTEQITDERLDRWKKRLSDEHATPFILIAVGHDHKQGQVVLCTVEDLSNDDLWKMLAMVLRTLEKQL